MKLTQRLVSAMSPASLLLSILALVVAAGGAGYAAGQIGTSGIKNNAITSPKIQNGEVHSADLGAGSVRRGKLAPGVQGARAYVHVTRDGSGGFVVDTARSKNVVNVVLPSTGNNDRPCLVLPAWIDATTAVAIGTIDAQNTDSASTAVIEQRVDGEGSQGCSGNSIALFLFRNGGSAGTATISFDVMVP